MKFHVNFLLLTTILFFTVWEAKSQALVLAPGEPASGQFFISIGLEPELVTTIGYLHVAGKLNRNADYHIGGSLKFAPLIISNRAWRLNFIHAASWKMSKAWKTQITANMYMAHDDNRAGEMNGIGTELRVTPAHIGNRWTKGLDIGWQYTFFTHIRHSAEAKDTFNERYPAGKKGIDGPEDGWYRSTAGRFRLGFAGSGKLGNHWRLQFGIGTLLSVQKQGILLGFSHAQVPFYFDSTVSFNY